MTRIARMVCFATVAAIDHMIGDPGILDSELARHARQMPKRDTAVEPHITIPLTPLRYVMISTSGSFSTISPAMKFSSVVFALRKSLLT